MEFTAIGSPAAGRTSEHDGGGPSSTTDQAQVEKEHMFDKVVTPSDVGKLNRLVIPKQHAEKYFPLDSTTAAASSTGGSGGGGGLLLSFEDRTGKPWRFRYSYWNSSQSYVMTKGWSRFVKEKRLDAGDTVSFGRGVGSEAAKGRLFIDWRRRPDHNNPLPPHALGLGRFTTLPNSLPFAPWTMTTTAAQQGRHHPFVSGSGGRAPFMQQQPTPPSFVYDDYDHGYYGAPGHGGGRQVLYYRPQQQQHAAVVLESVPVRMGMAMAAEEAVPSSGTKRVRLFGVNLDYSEEDSNSNSRPAQAMQLQQLMSPASSTSTSSSSGKARCSLNLDL